MVTQTHVAPARHSALPLVAWITLLVASLLPNILTYELTGTIPNWLVWAKPAAVAALIGTTLVWKQVRPLRNFFLILLALYGAEQLPVVLETTTSWRAWFGGTDASFARSMAGTQLGRLLVSLAMIVALLVLGYRRADFFLTKGQLDAPIEPVRWLGFPKPEPWTRFGAMWSGFIALGLLAFLLAFGHPSWATFVVAAPLLPAVALFAAMNAFSEEMTYRAPLLAGLEPVLGARQAVSIAALFFGIGHYFGVPYGIIGVAMASFLGWLLGKAMVETRGFFWAWSIHFVQDILIFAFMAAGSIRPGG
jgi:membrane protease YdiL (CAAX protease family)